MSGDGSAALKGTADSAKVAAFAKRMAAFASKDGGRPSIIGGWRVAPGAWAATDGHRLAILPAPRLADGTYWGDDVPVGVTFPAGPLVALCAVGVPVACKVYSRWKLAVGDAAVAQVDASPPDHTKIIPRKADRPNTLTIDPAAIRALFLQGADEVTPAERVTLAAAGVKVPRLGTERLGARAAQVTIDAEGRMACKREFVSRVPDDDGVWRGNTSADLRQYGDGGDGGEPVICFDARYLVAVADRPYKLHYLDPLSPAFAIVGGEAHIIMPQRL